MFEAGSLFGFAVGVGCGLCIGWLMKGKYRSKAVSLAADKNMVSDVRSRNQLIIAQQSPLPC